MQKQQTITTAANSKILNAIENTKLFAAAVEVEPVIDFKDAGQDLENKLQVNKPLRKQKKVNK